MVMKKFKTSTYIIWGILTFFALVAFIAPFILFTAD